MTPGQTRTPQTSFARLTHLSLVDFSPERNECSWTSLLNPSTVPALLHLIIVTSDHGGGNSESFVEALGSIAPQLESFAFVDYVLMSPPILSTLWTKLFKLKHLYLSIWRDVFTDVLSDLETLVSPSLSSLAFGANDTDDSIVMIANSCQKLLQNSSTFLPAFETLSLFGWSINDFANDDDEEDEEAREQAHRNLQKLMESRGGTLLVEKNDALGMAPAWDGYECPWCASRFRRCLEPPTD